jgi:uncharacterized membrane protein
VGKVLTICRGQEKLRNEISEGSTAALVLHPIACGLTFLAFVFALLLIRRGYYGERASRPASFISLGTALLAAFLTTIAFLIDAIVVGVVKSEVRKDTDGVVTLNWGNAVFFSRPLVYPYAH